jgi:MSV199 domain
MNIKRDVRRHHEKTFFSSKTSSSPHLMPGTGHKDYSYDKYMEATSGVLSMVTKNPLKSVSDHARLSHRLADAFSGEDKQQFLMNFYMYQNHHTTDDYVVDLDEVFGWLGYSKKDKAKDLLQKHFTLGTDYKISFPAARERLNGGQNREIITMNIETFKKLCLKANTKKADEIHNYYIKLERVVNELVQEEMEDMKLKMNSIRERTLIESYDNKPVVYLGSISSVLTKFGYTNNIKQRTEAHKREIGSVYVLQHVIECAQNVDLEDKLKQHNDIHNRRCKDVFNGKTQTKLIRHDQFMTIDDVAKIITRLRDTMTNDKECAIMKHEEKMTEELTKQKQLDLEMKRVELEMKRLELQSLTTAVAKPVAAVSLMTRKKRKRGVSTSVAALPITHESPEDTIPIIVAPEPPGPTEYTTSIVTPDPHVVPCAISTSDTCTNDVMMFLISLWNTNRSVRSIILTTGDLHKEFVDFLKTVRKYTPHQLLLWGMARLGTCVRKLGQEAGITKLINYGPSRTSAYAVDLTVLRTYFGSNGFANDVVVDS